MLIKAKINHIPKIIYLNFTISNYSNHILNSLKYQGYP